MMIFILCLFLAGCSTAVLDILPATIGQVKDADAQVVSKIVALRDDVASKSGLELNNVDEEVTMSSGLADILSNPSITGLIALITSGGGAGILGLLRTNRKEKARGDRLQIKGQELGRMSREEADEEIRKNDDFKGVG